MILVCDEKAWCDFSSARPNTVAKQYHRIDERHNLSNYEMIIATD